MVSAPLVALLGMIAFACASIVFALAETALFSLGKWRAKHLAEKNPGAGATVLRLLDAPRETLAAIVLGNTLANTAILAIALWMSIGAEETDPTWTIIGTFALILFGCEVGPKTLAVRMPEEWALRLAHPLSWFVRSCSPVLRLVQNAVDKIVRAMVPKSFKPMAPATDEDYQELLDIAYQQGTLGQSEKEIILEIISLDQQTVGDVMSSRSQMTAIPYDLSHDDLVAAAREHKRTRIPLFRGDAETIVGVLNTRNLLLGPDVDLEDAIEFPSFVPESMNLLTLFQSLQRQRRGMAIVVDEYGGTAGVVTVQDILEEMIGKIRAEGETPGMMVEHLGPNQWLVKGEMLIEEFKREHPELPEREDVDTLGGLFVALHEVVPEEGESTRCGTLLLTATEVTERRVLELKIERAGRAMEN